MIEMKSEDPGVDVTEEEFIDELEEADDEPEDKELDAADSFAYTPSADLGPMSGITTWQQAFVYTILFSAFILILASVLFALSEA